LGGERTGGECDGGIKEDGCDTASGESGGKARGEEHRGETFQTQGVLESYIFMDVPLSDSFVCKNKIAKGIRNQVENPI